MNGSPIRASSLQMPALLGGGPGGAQPAAPSDRGIDLPDLGPCRHRLGLLILLFDNSPSVAGGNDLAGTRFAEAALALDRLRRRCQCQRELVAVRTLDRHTTADVGPVPLSAQGWADVTAALGAPPEVPQPSSRMRPALVDAERLAHAHPLHGTTLVVFSDFELLDAFPGLVFDRMAKFPGDVHALVLGTDPPRHLVSIGVTVSRITADSRSGDVARAVVEALR